MVHCKPVLWLAPFPSISVNPLHASPDFSAATKSAKVPHSSPAWAEVTESAGSDMFLAWLVMAVFTTATSP